MKVNLLLIGAIDAPIFSIASDIVEIEMVGRKIMHLTE